MSRTITLVLSILALEAFAQDQNKVDSLLALTTSDVSTQEKVDAYNELAFMYVNVDSATTHQFALQAIELAEANDYPQGVVMAKVQIGWTILRAGYLDDAAIYFQQAKALAEELNFQEGIADAAHGWGTARMDLGQLDEGLILHEEALAIRQEINDLKGIGLSYNQIGIVHAYMGDYPTCLEYFLKALDIQQQRGDEATMAGNYNNIALVYERLDQTEKALEYYQKALNINEEQNNVRGMALNNLNIVNSYRDLDQNDRALEHAEKSLTLSKELGSKRLISMSLGNLGALHTDLRNFKKAMEYQSEANKMHEEQGDIPSFANSSIQLGQIYSELGRYSESLSYLRDGQRMAAEIGNPDMMAAAYNHLSDTYAALGQYRNAYEAHVQFKELADSVVNDENTRQLARVEAEYDFKQEKDSLQFAQAQERLAFETDIEQRSFTQLVTLIGLILTGALVLVIYFSLRAKQRVNRQLMELNGEIKSQRDSLEALNHMKTRLFSIISHDLRGPMSTFIGFYDLLSNHIEKHYKVDGDEHLKKMQIHMHDSSNRALQLMDSLLKWALKEEDAIPYHPKKLNLQRVIFETVEALAPQALAKEITLESTVVEPQHAWADKNSLMTIFRNLMNNALKFTPEGGTVEVSAQTEEDTVVITVKDSGIGIPQEKLEKLFDMDEKKVTKGTKGEKGSGLGLNLVYDFVQMNKGTIEVTSEEGVGTTFSVSLPAHNEEPILLY